MKKYYREIKQKTIKELESQLKLLREEIGKLKLELKINPQKDTNILRKKQKQLAVILTLLTEKEEIEILRNK